MKKYLSLLLGMLLMVGFAGSALAIQVNIPSDDSTPVVATGSEAITLSGEMRERNDFGHIKFEDNCPDHASFDQRTRLGVQANLSPNTKGFIQFESNRGDTNNEAPCSFLWDTGLAK